MLSVLPLLSVSSVTFKAPLRFPAFLKRQPLQGVISSNPLWTRGKSIMYHQGPKKGRSMKYPMEKKNPNFKSIPDRPALVCSKVKHHTMQAWRHHHVEQGEGQQGPTKLSPMTPGLPSRNFSSSGCCAWKTNAISPWAILSPKDTAFVGRIQIGQKRPNRVFATCVHCVWYWFYSIAISLWNYSSIDKLNVKANSFWDIANSCQ